MNGYKPKEILPSYLKEKIDFMYECKGIEVALLKGGDIPSDVEISLPQEFTNNICSASLWLDGKIVKESPKIDLTQVSKYTFEDITSSTKNAMFQVKIKPDGSDYQEYQDINVDFCTTNKQNIVSVVYASDWEEQESEPEQGIELDQQTGTDQNVEIEQDVPDQDVESDQQNEIDQEVESQQDTAIDPDNAIDQEGEEITE